MGDVFAIVPFYDSFKGGRAHPVLLVGLFDQFHVLWACFY